MSTFKQGRDQGVRTREGMRIWKVAVQRAPAYEDKRDAAKTKKDRERYDELRIHALNKGLEEALAQDPKPKPAKKKRVPVRLKR